MTAPEKYEPPKVVQDIHYSHDHNYNPATSQDDFNRWQVDLIHHYLPNMAAEDQKRARRTPKELTNKIKQESADFITDDPLESAKETVRRMKARRALR